MHIIILNAFGAVLMAFAALYVGMKIGVWVASGKDESGGAPEIDGIVFPPLFLTFGLPLIHNILMEWIHNRSQ